jgi:hypothetical protein
LSVIRSGNVLDLRGGGDVVDAGHHLAEAQVHRRAADLALAGAETAVDGAGSRGQQQHPVGIAVDDGRRRRQVLLVEGIVGHLVFVELRRVGDALAPDRVADFLDQTQVVGGDAHRVALDDPLQGSGVDGETLGQPFGAGQALSQTFLPGFHVRMVSFFRRQTRGRRRFTAERLNTSSAPLYQEVTFKQDFLPPRHGVTKKIKNKKGLLGVLVPWWQNRRFLDSSRQSSTKPSPESTVAGRRRRDSR